MCRLLSVILIACAMLSPARGEPITGTRGGLTAIGAELVLRLSDGRTFRRQDLIGVHILWSDGRAQLRIDGVQEAQAVGGPIPLYDLALVGPASEPVEFCQPDPAGRRAALAYEDGNGGFRLTCTSGAEGKCILFGYRPWDLRPDAPMRDLHRACIHMLRADYGGDDHPTTRDGTLVDLYDRFGIQMPESSGTMTFEAAWGVDGAVCVAHPRIAGAVTLDELARRYPHLASRLGPDACNDAAMRREPRALIFNRSVAASR